MASRIRLLLVLSLIVCCGKLLQAQQLSNVAFENESLTYVISYKWGLVQKDAGKAKLTLLNRNGYYEIKLAAATLPWADKVFCVRDTLSSWVKRDGFKPLKYIKTTHEGGKYNRDYLVYSYDGNKVTGSCNRTKVRDGNVKKSTFTSTVSGKTFDMLSIFYYIRSLDFGAMKKGKSVKANILSGSSPEVITISNQGVENVKMPDGKKYQCYHIRFTFTTDSGKSDSYPMDTWITVDAPYIPVKLVGTLPIGKVQAFLTGAKVKS